MIGLGIYLFLIIVTGLLSLSFLWCCLKNKWLALLLSSLLIATAIIFTHLYLTPYRLLCLFNNEVNQQNTFFVMLRNHHEPLYLAYLTKIKNKIYTNGDYSDRANDIAELRLQLLGQYGKKASDETLYRYLQEDYQYKKMLYKMNPIFVLYDEYPEKFKLTVNDKEKMSQVNKQALNDSIEAVIESGIKEEHSLLNSSELVKAELNFKSLIRELNTKHSEKVVINAFKEPENNSRESQKFADIHLELNQMLLSKPKQETAMMIRAALTVKNPTTSLIPPANLK